MGLAHGGSVKRDILLYVTPILCRTSALRLHAVANACYSLYICARAFGPRYGGLFPLTIEIEETYVAAKEICHVMLVLIVIGICSVQLP